MESTVWFITGSSRGLGLAIVNYALEQGAKVVATARDPSSLDALISQYGQDHLLTLPLDVTDFSAAQSAAQKTIEQFGRVDIIINNAGYADVAAVEETSIESFKDQIETNLMGVVNVSKTFIPILRKQGTGHIFQISSLGSRAASPGLGAYQAAKYAVAGFSGVLAAELKPFNIRVTCLEPGAMDTEWAAEHIEVGVGYQETVGKHKERFAQALKGRPTKVEKVGGIIWRLFGEEGEVPVRFLMGGDAVVYGRMLGEQLRESDGKWAELGESTSD